jgi:hypothetical protein
MHKLTLALPLAACALLAGCASSNLVPPDQLATPSTISCIQLPEALMATDLAGILKLVTETRLERGPYVSEKEDAQGTYYRAPQGGLSQYQPGGNFTGKRFTMDGGFFIPKDPQKLPSLYVYTSMSDSTPVVPPEGASCANVSVTKDPVTQKLSIGLMAAAGGLGGAAGRAAVPHSGISYGQAAAGGAIAGALVAYLVNQDLGKIAPITLVKDPVMLGKLRELSTQAVPVATVQGSAGAESGGAPR